MDAPMSEVGRVDGYGVHALAAVIPPATAGGRRVTTVPRATRRLYHAEQLMEERKLPKKKYLATQRLRRDLERSSVESLKLDVNFLRQEIVNLRTVREIVQAQRLTTRVDTTGEFMSKVAQFFVMIKHGVGGEAPSARLSAADKIHFLRGIMHEDLRFGTSTSGVDNFIQQCAGYTLFHSHFCMEAPKMREVQSPDNTNPIIVATSQLRVRILRKSLEVVFPHTLSDEMLVQELIGQELVYPLETRFYFDGEGKVVRYDADVDFVTGLNTALKSLRRVTDIMVHARLDGFVILMNEDIDARRLITLSDDGDGCKDEMEAVAGQYDGTEEVASLVSVVLDGDGMPAPVIPELSNPAMNRMSIGRLLS